MARLDRKDNENRQGENNSLSSFEKKGAKIAFNAQKRTKGKYKVVNVQSRNGEIFSASSVVYGENSAAVSKNSGNAKSVKNAVNENKQTYRRSENYSHGTAHQSESAVWESEKTISPEMAQRMKIAAYLQEQNSEKIKINTANAAYSDRSNYSKKGISAENREHKPYENKYVSQTIDSTIPEQKKIISPEMALRMKRAEYLAQKNEEALRLNRVTVIDIEEKQEVIPNEKSEYLDEQANVPPEHLEYEQEKPQENTYLGNSENAVFDTYNDDVRAYKVQKAYGKYIQKQKNNARNSGIDRLAETVQTVGEISHGNVGKVISDAVIGSVTGESVQNAVSGIETVSQAAFGSDSVGGTVLDVSVALAAIEAKKLVKKLAETEIKKKHRVDERMRNHGNRFGIDKYDEVTGKNEKTNKSQKESDRHSETAYEKQRSTKVGSSNKLREEKQEYAKVQRAKEVRGRQKEIFIKENKKIPDSVYASDIGKGAVKRFVVKKGASLIFGGGFGAVILPILLVIILFIVVSGFFGWLSPFKYGLAGEAPGTEHNAETKAEVIGGYTLMVKNYMDVTQAYYYLNYGDWYGGTYQYESLELDFGTFFSDYCQKIIDEKTAFYQPLIDSATTPAQAMALSRAMSEAINQVLANAQQAALDEYAQLTASLDDTFTPDEHRQHYEVEIVNSGNGIDDSADFNDKPIPGTNFFGNVEINSDLSAEEMLAYIALYKSLLTINSDETPTDPDAADEENSLNITPEDIMNFFEETEYITITAEVTHDNLCPNQNCKRRLLGDATNGYSWEYYCDGDHDNLTGEIGECLSADELLEQIMELTEAEDTGVDEDACKELIEEYLDMFKEELDIDEGDFRRFGAADNEKAQEFYELLITGELQNADLWEVETPITEAE